MFKYIAYGLGIRSELILPELIKADLRSEIEIKRRRLDLPLQSVAGCGIDFWATEYQAYHIYANTCSFFVHDGREIIFDPVPNADERLLRLYLLGRIFGILLHQRGLLVLHGSAIELDKGAVAFLGGCGSGKSTVAASMVAEGCSVVADDLVVVDVCSGVPVVYPAFPQLKLCSDVAESLGYDVSDLPYVSPKESKHIAQIAHGFSTDPLPLRQIYLLEKGETLDIKRTGPQEAMIELVRNSYAIRSLNAGANLLPHFLQCSKVAKDIPIYQLIRPFELKSLGSLARSIKDIASQA